MAGNVENKITIETAAVIWLACTAIALGSYWAHIDIAFWPGFISWSVFIIGVIYFILLVLARIFG
jgi:hypothetical protein